MRLLAATSKLAFVGTQYVTRHAGLATSLPMRSAQALSSQGNHAMISAVSHHNFDTRLFSSGGGPQEVTLQDVGKEEMEEILEDYEEGGREESGYVVLDVREVNEIEYTGKLSPNTITFPLQKVMQYNAFALDDDEFEEIFGFEKPGMDETLVFSCAMGVRSVHAANFAAQGGYTKLVNYRGGANQWFL